MMEKMLDLKFKGERNYLHGTDIFDETVTWLNAENGEIKDIDFTFYRLALRQLKAIGGIPPDGIEAVAVCSFTAHGVRQKAYLVESEQLVTGRYPYHEDEIVSQMEMDLVERRGVLRGETTYSDIEVWVAMTKALHYKALPHLKGKWLFVRGRFPLYVRHSSATERTLHIAASFNDKLTRSEALIDGVKVGEIYFSIV